MENATNGNGSFKLPIYLDYSATTPVDPRVADEMARHLTFEGNFGSAKATR